MSGYSKIIVVLVLIAITAALAMPAVADGWDFKSQFSLKGNPNGDWSYGYIDKEGQFKLFSSTFTDGKSIAGWALEGNPSAAGDITVNLSDKQLDAYCTVWETGQVLIHPPLGGGITIVRWTSPVDAEIRIDTNLTAQAYSTVADVKLVGNYNYLLEKKSIEGFKGKGEKSTGRTGKSPEGNGSIVVNVAKGDTIDIGISTSDDHLSSAQIGLEIRIKVLKSTTGLSSFLEGKGSVWMPQRSDCISSITSTPSRNNVTVALGKGGER